ncbi:MULTISPECIES: hypothetical protein [Nocardiaceae]|nr:MULTISPECIES: hypothetical protein [Rhodococcus]AMY20299.1 hypothetical protein A3Q40_02936 [Rhodococcus sp. PBTS 1]
MYLLLHGRVTTPVTENEFNVFDRGDPARRAPRAPVGSIDRPAGP